MPKRKGVETKKLQPTVDATTLRILNEMVPLGIHGGGENQVAAWIIRTWIWENQERLRSNGIRFSALNN